MSFPHYAHAVDNGPRHPGGNPPRVSERGDVEISTFSPFRLEEGVCRVGCGSAEGGVGDKFAVVEVSHGVGHVVWGEGLEEDTHGGVC